MSEVINVPAIFGADVFNESAMEQTLRPEIYNAWKHCIQTDTPLGLDVANEIAEAMKEWAIKIAILGTALVCVIPFSIDFTQKVSEDYLAYVDETIAEANAGAEKIYEIKAVNEEEDTFLEKISDVFVNAYQGVKDLFTYFNNLTKRCINSIAIIMVITFVLPLLTLVFFRWLLKELFSLNLNIFVPKIKEIQIVKKQ